MGDKTKTRSLAFGADVAPADCERIRALLPELDRLESEALQDLVTRLWAHSWRCSAWADPADAYMTISKLPADRDPYKERWNQIEHTRAVIALVDGMLPTFERHVGAPVDREILYLSALLHDVAKLIEYAPGGAEGPAKAPAAVVHHAAVGAQWALEAGLPPSVAHAIVAHSPSTSATPQTIEALVVKLADQVVTDLNRMTTVLESEA
jgi:putative nucleotidyltransferase with HDIG domain